MNVLEISGLRKAFGGHAVLEGLDLTVPEGSVFGFVGQNGAGKTTTMRLILGLLRADAGSIAVCGAPVSYGGASANRHVGYLPDVPAFYGFMTAPEYLRFCGDISGLSRAESRASGERLLTLVGLEGVKRRIGGFSRGMRQRLGIAQALIGRPRLLLCDEPTSALDPTGRKEILEVLAAIAGETTVVFSTHILADVERICGHVAILHRGRLAACGPLDEVKAHAARDEYAVRFTGEAQAEAFCAGLAGCSRDGALVTLPAALSGEAIGRLAAMGLVPERFERRETTLEQVFLEVIGE